MRILHEVGTPEQDKGAVKGVGAGGLRKLKADAPPHPPTLLAVEKRQEIFA
jgi:hypothetical protein